MFFCYKPESCIYINNCSVAGKETCDQDTDLQLYLQDRFFNSLDGRFCKGITCCPKISCGDVYRTLSPTPMYIEEDHEKITKSNVNFILLSVICVFLFLFGISCILYYTRTRRVQIVEDNNEEET